MLEIKLNADDINQHVIDAITNSMVGENFKEAVNKAFKGYLNYSDYSRDNPVKNAVDRSVSKYVYDMVSKKLTNDPSFEIKINEIIQNEVLPKLGKHILQQIFPAKD